jgi:hypothetical protein
MTLTHDTIIATVRLWPAPQRAALVRELIISLATETQMPTTTTTTLSRAFGLLATTEPAPTDEEIRLMLQERQVEKYLT